MAISVGMERVQHENPHHNWLDTLLMKYVYFILEARDGLLEKGEIV
jgi:hypothetical protein